jgi:hypothetical protein
MIERYTFDKIHDAETDQATLFNDVVKPLVNDFLHGKNGLFFVYGASNSGKTYTVHGTDDNPGVIPRVLSSIFASIKDQRGDGSVCRLKCN